MWNKGIAKSYSDQGGNDFKKTRGRDIGTGKKTESEITLSDHVVMGDIYIGTGETDAVRLIAKVARSLQESIPESIIIYPVGMPIL